MNKIKSVTTIRIKATQYQELLHIALKESRRLKRAVTVGQVVRAEIDKYLESKGCKNGKESACSARGNDSAPGGDYGVAYAVD
jgi:hypothetical protein